MAKEPYKVDSYWRKKINADNRARKMRAKGYDIRVTSKKGMSPDKKYCVWWRTSL